MRRQKHIEMSVIEPEIKFSNYKLTEENLHLHDTGRTQEDVLRSEPSRIYGFWFRELRQRCPERRTIW